MRRTARLLATTALVLGPLGALNAATAAAPTPTTVGEVSPPSFGVSCLGQSTLIQETSRPGASSYDMPFDGVITSFSTRTSGSDHTAQLIMVSQVTATTFKVMTKSAPLPTLAGVINTYSVRVPVKTGWKIGANIAGGCGDLTEGTDDLNTVLGATDVGSTVTGNSIGVPARLNIAVELEPDVDGDGYGDVTQDACPESALAVVACPAPETTITKAPKATSKKRKVTVGFTSSLPRSTFLVSVDGKPAVEMLSPYRAKLKPGRHTVTVVAVSPLGIADQTAASTSFQIKKPRHRR